MIISIILSIVFAIISYLLWLFYGKDLPTKKEMVKKINLNPLEVGMLINENASLDDSYYYLIYLANKNYIKIEEDKGKFTIHKNKDIEIDNEIDKLFIASFFSRGDDISLSEYIKVLEDKSIDESKIKQGDKVGHNSLKRKFTYASNRVLEHINSIDNKNKYFEKKAEHIKKYLIVMVAIIIFFITAIPFIENKIYYFLPLSVIFSIIYLYVLYNYIKSLDFYNKNHRLSIIIIILLILVIFLLIPTFRNSISYIIAFLINAVCSIIILICYKYMPKRTMEGTKLYNKILGFKDNFKKLKNNELDKEYLYDILPISYILGFSSDVYEKLNELKIDKPNWYSSIGRYSHNKLNRSLYELKKIMTNI